MLTRTATLGAISIATVAAACGRIPSATVPAPRVWFLASPMLTGNPASGDSSGSGALIILDSAAFRPVLARRGNGVVTFTSYHGTRYHPETVRAVAEQPSAIDTFSARVATLAISSGDGLLVDFQDMAASDLPAFFELVRAMAGASRARSVSPFGIIVPAGDTLAYPASLLSRAADIVVVRLGTEHRPGTPPGPLTSPDFIRRQLGARAIAVGAARLAAELPLYGFIWYRDGSARPITYRDANALLLREAGAFRRDPASQFLTAEGRDGSTLWLPDAQTIDALIHVVQSRGVNTIALSGGNGADPRIRALAK